MTISSELFKKKLKTRLKKHTLRKIPKIIKTEKIYIEYFKKIKKIVTNIKVATEKELIEKLPALLEQYQRDIKIDSQKIYSLAKLDGYSEFIKEIFENLRFEVGVGTGATDETLIGITNSTAKNISSFHKKQFNKVFKTVLGVSPTLTEKWLEPKIESFIERNIALIESIPEEYFSKLETTIRQGVESGKTTKELKEEIQKAINNKLFDRAQLIARDQTNKFFGNLNELRQKEAGVSKYKWRTSKELSVRGRPDGLYPNADPSHWEREGVTFSWDDPPEDGHPGFACNCNCYAEPVLDEFIIPFA